MTRRDPERNPPLRITEPHVYPSERVFLHADHEPQQQRRNRRIGASYVVWARQNKIMILIELNWRKKQQKVCHTSRRVVSPKPEDPSSTRLPNIALT